MEDIRKDIPMEVQWRYNTNQSIQLRWHGSYSNIEVFNNKRSIANVEQKLSPINFHFSPTTGYTFVVSPTSESDKKASKRFNFASNWLVAPFELVVMVDDSWSVGPIDFAREVDFTKMIFKGLNPSVQKSAVVLYSHRTRVLKKFQDPLVTGFIIL